MAKQDNREMKFVKKITVATCYGEIEPPEGELSLIQVAGVADELEYGESQYGQWTAFRGDFIAVNMQTGEKFRSWRCLLPDMAKDMLASAMKNAESQAVEFGFEISVTPSAKGRLGYEYQIRPLIQVEENDRLKALTERLGGQLLLSKPGE